MSLDIIKRNEFGYVEKTHFSDEELITTAEGLTISHQYCEASISLYGGHVLTWQPANQKPVFWMSEATSYGNGKAIRGGIPICFPWFGPFESTLFDHTKNQTLSSSETALLSNHGFARTSHWQLDSVDISETEVKVVLSLSGENASPVWNIPYTLKQELIFGESFSQKLIIVNKSQQAIQYTGALHSYFAVSSPDKTFIDELSDVHYFDKLTGDYDQKSVLQDCSGPKDRVYSTNNQMNIVDEAWQRTITVTSFDCNQWVLWNPGKDIAKGMKDIHAEGETEYVCLEAANTTPVAIPAESTVSFAQHITLTTI